MIEIKWRELEYDDDIGWQHCRCLYAYLAPDGKEILYIGKAWATTVRKRWERSGKIDFWGELERERGIAHHIPLIGEITLPVGQNSTNKLLLDIETLLINKEQPWGNIQARNTRISRPGMIVYCKGDWPGSRKYIDK